ncbi:MAG: quinoprotein relay system zinc metallohydrolase 2 [Gammaproteobacteria bacterium]
MATRRCRFIPLLALLACCCSYASEIDELSVDAVAPGVFVHLGQAAEVDSPDRGDSANIGFVIGAHCVAIIDSGGALATGRALGQAIAKRTAKPVCYVINTHVHFDHVLGNAAFEASAPDYVGHHRLADAMAANRDFFAENFAHELGGESQQVKVIGPDTLVEDELELDLGDRRLRLRAVASAHSTTDLTVLDALTNTLWAGDLLSRERMPVLDGSLLGWLDWMRHAMQQDYAHVIPGHGPIDHAWPDGARAQLRYLEALRDDTRAAVAAGTMLQEAQGSVAAEQRRHWQLTERAHPLNVNRAYRELEWE